MKCRVATAMEHNCCRAWLWRLWVFKGRLAVLTSLSDNTCLWLDLRICEQFWSVCWLFYLDSSTWTKISSIGTYVTTSFNFSFRQKGSIVLSLSIVNWMGGNQRIRWDGQAAGDTIQFFISGLGLKTLSCSLFNLLDLDLEVL
jgi:hypothetical protein